MDEQKDRRGLRAAYLLGIIATALTILMALAIIYFGPFVKALQGYGYFGAFFISILAGITYFIPVPALAVIFALGGVMKFPWLVAIAAGLGETIGAAIVYYTGYSGWSAFAHGKKGKIQAAYERMLRLMALQGSLLIFLLAVTLNPFFYPAALAAGALHFSIKKYLVISWIGKTIKNMTLCYAGYFGLRSLFNALGIPL